MTKIKALLIVQFEKKKKIYDWIENFFIFFSLLVLLLIYFFPHSLERSNSIVSVFLCILLFLSFLLFFKCFSVVIAAEKKIKKLREGKDEKD